MRTGARLSMLPDRDTFVSNPGLTYNVIYSPVIGEDGNIELMETGREDIAEMINSYADQCDMSLIMARLAAGDDSVLYRTIPQYGDVSMCTWDHRAMLQTIVDARNYFDHLPADKREKFNNSFEQWYSTAGTPEWATAMTTSPAMPSDNTEKGETE